MPKHLRAYPRPLLFILAAGYLAESLGVSLLMQSPASAANDLKGIVEVQSNTPAAPSTFLEGGIKNEATLNPSLKMIPGQASSARPLLPRLAPDSPFGSQVSQYAGSVLYSPGGTAPTLPFAGRTPHYIPPISTYTLTPRSGVMSYAPGYEMTNTPGQKGVMNFGPSIEMSPPSRSGVTSYAPGYEMSAPVATTEKGVTSYASSSLISLTPVTRSGVTSYAPGFEVSTVTVRSITNVDTDMKVANAGGPGQSIAGVTTGSGITNFTPGFQVSISTPQKGVVCWAPGYEVSIQSGAIEKSTLGGMWFTPGGTQPDAGLTAKTEALKPNTMFAQPVVSIEQPLLATAMSLPDAKVQNTSLSWDQWYKQVARAIYARWQSAEVGPGMARVRVTADRAHNLSCQVVEFSPAPDVTVDAEGEREFREAALTAVNLVSSFEIPPFPTDDCQKVSFEVEMKRVVDGPRGIDVSAVAGEPAKAGSVPGKSGKAKARPKLKKGTRHST